MVDADLTFVIVGGGLAGAKAAETLRSEGFTGRVILIGDERDHPYERPPLSKGFLTGEKERDSVFVHDTGWYAQADIELHLGQSVVHLDRATRTAVLGDGTALRYDKLLLATGSEPRRLDIPGTGLAGVHHLRRLSHAERLRGPYWPPSAATTGISSSPGPAGSAWKSRPPRAVTAPRSPSSNPNRPPSTQVRRPRASASSSPTCTASTESASTSAPASPRSSARTAWSSPPAPTTARSTSPTTSSPRSGPPRASRSPRPRASTWPTARTAAASRGRRAAHLRPRHLRRRRRRAAHRLLSTRLRVEHWANALNGGPAAARAMLGQEVSYDRVPYFFSDQYDLGLEYSGWAPPGTYDQVVIRGDAGKREFIAFWLKDNRVLAGMNVNVWDVTETVQALIRSGAPVDTYALSDPSVDLASLLG